MPQAIKCSGKREVARGRVRAYGVGKATTETCNMVTVQTCRGVTKEKPEVVELYNKNMFRVDTMDQLAKSVKQWQKVVLVVAGIYCQQLHLIHHHSSTAWTTTPKSSSVLSGVYPAACCRSATITTTKPLWSPCRPLS